MKVFIWGIGKITALYLDEKELNSDMILGFIESKKSQDYYRGKRVYEPNEIAIRDDYDYIFLDCAPARGPLLFMAYIACDYCIVVSDAEISSIDGIKNIIIDLQTLEKNTIKAKAKILGLLLTQNKDYNVHLEQYQRLIEFTKYGAVPFDTTIYEGVIVKEAHNKYMSISAYVDAGNRAIKQKAKSVLDSYKDLQREIEERIKEMEA